MILPTTATMSAGTAINNLVMWETLFQQEGA
jgi:hypothetical protein